MAEKNFSQEDIDYIRYLYRNRDYSVSEIAEEFDVTDDVIVHILEKEGCIK